MLEKIGLFSDNIYKFLTSLSLVVFIYCASFPILFLDKYNDNSVKLKKEWIDFFARYHFYRGMKYNLRSQLGTTGKGVYHYYLDRDTGSTFPYYEGEERFYQFFYPSSFDSSKRKLVDSLNWVSQEEFKGQEESTISGRTCFNAKVKAFRATQRGVRDVTFFLFRLSKIYA